MNQLKERIIIGSLGTIGYFGTMIFLLTSLNTSSWLYSVILYVVANPLLATLAFFGCVGGIFLWVAFGAMMITAISGEGYEQEKVLSVQSK